MDESTQRLLPAGGHDNENCNAHKTKRQPHHRRSLSHGSIESCNSKTGNKCGKVRRKLQWSMKDLLQATSLMTMENASDAISARTCATETSPDSAPHQCSSTSPTADLSVTTQTTSQYSKRRSPLRETNELVVAGKNKKVLPSFRVSKASGSQRRLIPRIAKAVLERMPMEQKKPLVLSPSTLQMEENRLALTDQTVSPVTKSFNLLFSDEGSHASNSTTMTPISPMRLPFECFEFPNEIHAMEPPLLDPREQEVATTGKKDAIDDDDDDESILSTTSFSSNDISLALFPNDNSKSKATSPLNSSPKLSSPPALQQSQKPSPFVLEKSLSESSCGGNTNPGKDFEMSDGEAKKKSISENQLSEPKGCQRTSPADSRTNVMEETSVMEDSEKEAPPKPTPTLSPLEKTAQAPEPGAEALLVARQQPGGDESLVHALVVGATKPHKPDLQKSQSERAYSKKNAFALNSASTRSMRTIISKSVPVDVDDAKFIDVEHNLPVIEQMAKNYLEHKEYDEALDAYKEILRGYLERHGYENANVGSALQTIVSIQMKRKNYDKAIQTGRKAVYIRKMALGEEHPDVAASLVQLGLCCFERKQYDSAMESFQQALAIRKKALGPRDLKVAKILNNMGCTFKQLRTNGEAILAFEEGLAIQRDALKSISCSDSAPHSDAFHKLSLSIAASLSNICTVKLSLGLIDEALDALQEAFKVRQSCNACLLLFLYLNILCGANLRPSFECCRFRVPYSETTTLKSKRHERG